LHDALLFSFAAEMLHNSSIFICCISYAAHEVLHMIAPLDMQPRSAAAHVQHDQLHILHHIYVFNQNLMRRVITLTRVFV
jgi:hypothetical protein